MKLIEILRGFKNLIEHNDDETVYSDINTSMEYSEIANYLNSEMRGKAREIKRMMDLYSDMECQGRVTKVKNFIANTLEIHDIS